MKEYQVFIPYGEERIAAAVTVPDEAVRGLVVLSTGLGATRSHRHQIWSRSARRLADVGIASIRWDYLGIGDSSGDIRVWGLAHLPIEQAVAVASFGMRCVGTDRLAVAGNCVGSWCSLALASRMPECIGAALIRIPVLAPEGLTLLKRRTKRSRIVRTLRRNRIVRRLLRRRLSDQRRGVLDVVSDSFPGAMAHGRLFFMYGENDFTFSERVRDVLAEMAGRLPAEHRGNYELRILPGERLHAFERAETQETVIGTVTTWLDELFAASPVAADRAPERSGARLEAGSSG